jgi:heme exporter protein C
MRAIDRVLLALSGATMVALLYLVFLYIPLERSQGFVQKIFFIHVPCAWVGFLAFTVTAIMGGRYLASRNPDHDRWAAASAEIGLVFTTLVLITGPLWGRPVWGIWWTWDVRLTSTLVLWLIYLAYLILRQTISEKDRRSTLAAVTGIIGWLGVPIVYMGNRVKASQHPAPVVGGGEGSGLAPIFLVTLLVGVAACTLYYIVLLRVRVRAARLEDRVEELQIAEGWDR